MEKHSVSTVGTDYLERLSKAMPVAGLAELVWNALDAEATTVRVETQRNELGGLTGVRITDNGHGATTDELRTEFTKLGDSWKASRAKTRSGKRTMHGKKGEGRFKAFALGHSVQWTSVFEGDDGKPYQVVVASSQTSIKDFTVSEAVEATGDTGTIVEIAVNAEQQNPLGDDAHEYLAVQFAPYLEMYPDVSITLDGTLIDPSSVIELSTEYDLASEGHSGSILKVIEWQQKKFQRALLLCDENGFALATTKAGIKAKGFVFTAYLLSSRIREAAESGVLEAWELSGDLRPLVEAARTKLRAHFGEREKERTAQVVDEWKADKVYPFKAEPTSPVEEVEREVFDYVAVTINDRIADFSDASLDSKRLSLSLVKEAIEQNPGSLNRILQEVLHLPEEQQNDFAELLEKASLSALIKASKKITDRLEFLTGLEDLVFDPQSKKALLERSQLHKIVEEETWVFGEEFALTVSDQSINEVLKKHIKTVFGREEISPEPVEIPEQKQAIVDLQLARAASDQHARREYLIAELKRPDCKLTSDEITQIKKYAYAIAGDERFRNTDTSWSFWLIGNELNEFANKEIEQDDRPHGLIVDKDGIRVWVKTWGQIIDAARRRMSFYQKELEYSPTIEEARNYLRERHKKALPDHLLEATDE